MDSSTIRVVELLGEDGMPPTSRHIKRVNLWVSDEIGCIFFIPSSVDIGVFPRDIKKEFSRTVRKLLAMKEDAAFGAYFDAGNKDVEIVPGYDELGDVSGIVLMPPDGGWEREPGTYLTGELEMVRRAFEERKGEASGV